MMHGSHNLQIVQTVEKCGQWCNAYSTLFSQPRAQSALVTLRASQGGFGVLRKLGPRGLSGPAGGEEIFEIALAFVHSEHDSEASLSFFW